MKTKYLVNSFTEGFSLGYQGPENVRQESPNLKIRIGDEIELWNKLMKEVELKCYAGPFTNVPFKNYIQSPIGLVPKDGGKSSRLIFHLSYPRDGKKRSVNANTPQHLCKVKYPDFTDAILRCMEEGVNCNLSRSDMRAAFRNLGICPQHWRYLVMKCKSPFDGKWYYFFDKALPFGSSISCKVFQDFSDSVAHIVQWKISQLLQNSNEDNGQTTLKKVINYLNDYLFASLTKYFCNQQVQIFLDTCAQINFPVSLEKTFWASMQMTFLGFLIDTVRQIVCIPLDKLAKGKNLINSILNAKKKKTTVL